MDQKINIRIEAQSNLDAIQKLSSELDKLKGKVRDVRSETQKSTGSTGGTLATSPNDVAAELMGIKKGATPAPEVTPLFEVFDENGRKAVEDAVKQLKAFRDTLPETSDELGELDRLIAGHEASLRGAGAATLAEIRALDAMAKAKSAAGQSTTELDAKILRLRKGLGQKMPTFGEQLKGELRDLGREFPMLGRGMELFERASSGALGKIMVAVTALAAAFKGAQVSLREFSEQEKEIAKLDTALARTGQLTDVYREKLHGLSEEMEDMSGIAKDQWMGALAQLIQMGMPVDEVDRYSAALVNAAGLMDGNLSRAANAVGKAMGGNFDIFREAGILIDQSVPKHERLNRLFEELAVRGGGQLESFGKTLSGTWTQLTTQTRNFAAGIGSLLDNFTPLRGIMQTATTALGYWADKMTVTQKPVEGLENAIKKTTKNLGDNADAIDRERAALETLNDVLEDTRSKYSALAEQQRELHQIRVNELKLQQELAVKQVEASDLPQSAKTKQIATIRGTFDKQVFQEVQAQRQREIETMNAELEVTRKQAAEIDVLVKKEQERLRVQSDYDKAKLVERDILRTIQTYREALNILRDPRTEDILGVPDNKYGQNRTLVDSIVAGAGSVPDKITQSEEVVERQLRLLRNVRRSKSEKEPIIADESDISLSKLTETQKKVQEQLEKIEREAAKQLPILSEQLQSEARKFQTRQQTQKIETSRELREQRKAEEAQRREAQAALLDNEARALRDKGMVPSAQLNQIATLRVRGILADPNTPADVKSMRVQDLREDTNSEIAGAFKSLRGEGMPKFSKAAAEIKSVMTEMNNGTGTLLDVARSMQAQIQKQAAEIQQLKNQQRYNLNQ